MKSRERMMLTLRRVDGPIKVLDMTKAVTSKLQRVGTHAQAKVPNVKNTLVIEGLLQTARMS